MKKSEAILLEVGTKLVPIPGRKTSNGLKLIRFSHAEFISIYYDSYSNRDVIYGEFFYHGGGSNRHKVFCDSMQIAIDHLDDYNVFECK